MDQWGAWITGLMVMASIYAFWPRRKAHSVPTARRTTDTPIRRHVAPRRAAHPFAVLAYHLNRTRLQIRAAIGQWQIGWRAAEARAPGRAVSSVSPAPPRQRVMSRSVHGAMMERRAANMTRGKIHGNGETGKERGIDDIMDTILRENALAELSKRCDNALQKYAKHGKIDTDTDVYALLGIRTEAGAKRLEKIRLDLAEAQRLAAEAERVKNLPRVPELEQMEPVPTS